MALTFMLDTFLTQWKTLTKQQLTPVLNSAEIAVRIQSDVSFCVFYHLKLSLPQLYHCQQLTDSQRFILGTTVRAVRAKGCSGQVCLTPQAFRELQECSCQCCYLGHPGLSDSRGEALLAGQCWTPQSLQDAPEAAGTAVGTVQLASRAQRAGEPQSWVDAWHTSLSHVFILLGCS